MSNVLVTGAAGFVGGALTRALVARGHAVAALVRDWVREPAGAAVVRGNIMDRALCQRILADYGIDTVYHLAAESIVSACAEDPLSALETATMGTAYLLQAVRDAGRPVKVVVSTSDKVYGAAPTPYDEGTPLDARHAYEVSKACQDLVARMFYYNYGVHVCIVRAVNIYGPGDPNGTRLVPRTAQRLCRGEPPLLHGGAATMKRQYIYIDDVVAAFTTVAEKGTAGHAYCVGSMDPPMSVLEVMRKMAAAAGAAWTTPDVLERAERFQEIAAQAVCDGKVRALGWAPATTFDVGIRRTLEWYARGK